MYMPRNRAHNAIMPVWLICIGLIVIVAVNPLVAKENAAKEDDDSPRRILIVTGEDYPGHKWRQTAPVLLAELSKDQRLVVDVLSDLKTLSTYSLNEYDSVLLHFKNYDPQVPGHLALKHLTDYVEQGGGLVLLHFACGAFEEHQEEFEA